MSASSLYLDDFEIERVRHRVTDPDWASSAETLRALADRLVAAPDEPPRFDRSWYDADPERDFALTYQPFHEYANPAMRLAGRLQRLLHAGRVFDAPRYADTAKRLAEPLIETFGFHVRHHDAGLCYSRVLGALADAYLYFRDGLDGPTDARWRGQIAAAGEAICISREHWATVLSRMPYNNHLAHHQAGLLAAGVVLERKDWIHTALNGRGGFAYLLPNCVLDDGLCHESSTVYHFGTLAGLLRSAELARHCPQLDRDLYRETFANGRTLKQMFDGPLGLMLPNGELPAWGDCYANRGPMWRGQRGLYELAYAVYGDPRYAWLLRRAGPRDTVEALLYGADTLGPTKHPRAKSQVWIEHGYALVTNRDDEAYWAEDDTEGIAAAMTGDLSGIHHHRDSLSLQVAAAGRVWVEDVESKALAVNGFSDPIQERFNRTAWAHNLVVVDERDQQLTSRPLPLLEVQGSA